MASSILPKIQMNTGYMIRSKIILFVQNSFKIRIQNQESFFACERRRYYFKNFEPLFLSHFLALIFWLRMLEKKLSHFF